MFRGFTKRRNHSTLQARQSEQSDVQSSGMAKRPMPSSFTSPCSLWWAFADLCSTCGAAIVGAGGGLLALVSVRCPFSARDVSAVGAKGSGYFAPKGEVAVE